MRSLFVSAAALVIAAAPAAAQKAGTVEVGAFGRVTWFGTSYQLQTDPGFGGRLGIFPLRNLEVEGEVSYLPTFSTDTFNSAYFDNSVKVLSFRGLLEYNINFRPLALVVGAGATYNSYGGVYSNSTLSNHEVGPMGLVGLRFGVGGMLQGRIDGTYEYMTTPAPALSQAPQDWNWGLQAGLSVMFPKEKPKDSDKDGVIDKLDQCPNTPLGTKVDDKGCPIPLDDDKDGVVNDRDQCPNTPMGQSVNSVGCSTCQIDTDRDGVPDCNDKCPNTPAGTKVNAQGCPEDADGDGVPDALDKCPSTQPGNKVDKVGCRIIFEETGGTFVIKGSSFAVNSAVLKPEAKVALTDAAIKINTILPSLPPDYKIWVQGHTDSTGTLAYNEKLSDKRAQAVKAFLITKGVPADRLEAKGYGPKDPIATNKTAAGRALNRRVSLYGGPTNVEEQ